MAYPHPRALPSAMGRMERLCFCAPSPRVAELWCTNQQPHLKACHQIELSALQQCIQIANGRVPGGERRSRRLLFQECALTDERMPIGHWVV